MWVRLPSGQPNRNEIMTEATQIKSLERTFNSTLKTLKRLLKEGKEKKALELINKLIRE